MSGPRPPVAVDEVIAGRALVDGRVITNPAARVRADAAVRLLRAARLRGDIKLSYALDVLDIDVDGSVCVDVGASAGGFTTALLDRGAARAYAVDVGTGQLVGVLRQDPRVVNLEGRNLGALSPDDITDVVDLVTVDLSYLALRDAVPQLEAITMSDGCELVALVKPMFELRLATPPTDRTTLRSAVDAARVACRANAWEVVTDIESPNRGRNGSIEFFVHARRTAPNGRP